MKTVVCLPAHNEEKAIKNVIDEVKKHSSADVIVVDNCSTDKTANIAGACGAIVLHEPQKGKGNAIKTALKNLDGGANCIILDSDYTYPAEYISKIVELLEDNDVVLCPRKYKDKGSMSLLNSFGNWFLTKLANMLYGTNISDLCTGMYGIKGGVVKKVKLASNGFTLEADLLTNYVKLGCKITELPIRYRCRIGGSKPKLQIIDGFKIAIFLIRRKFGK